MQTLIARANTRAAVPTIHVDGRRNPEADMHAALGLAGLDARMFAFEVLGPRFATASHLLRAAVARFCAEEYDGRHPGPLLDALDGYCDVLKAEGVPLVGW